MKPLSRPRTHAFWRLCGMRNIATGDYSAHQNNRNPRWISPSLQIKSCDKYRGLRGFCMPGAAAAPGSPFPAKGKFGDCNPSPGPTPYHWSLLANGKPILCRTVPASSCPNTSPAGCARLQTSLLNCDLPQLLLTKNHMNGQFMDSFQLDPQLEMCLSKWTKTYRFLGTVLHNISLVMWDHPCSLPNHVPHQPRQPHTHPTPGYQHQFSDPASNAAMPHIQNHMHLQILPSSIQGMGVHRADSNE